MSELRELHYKTVANIIKKYFSILDDLKEPLGNNNIRCLNSSSKILI